MLRFRLVLTLVALLLAALLPALAFADDWVVTKLRGGVLQLVDAQWAPLSRGDVVPDDRVLRSLKSGRAELQRGAEVISIGPETQIQIHDKAGKPFTTVRQHFGTVEIDAEARQVKHFAVQTPYLAAVVKGTNFTVTTGKKGSMVAVRRGHVAVTDSRSGLNTLLARGQEASVGVDGSFAVDGKGTPPAILDKAGKPASAANARSSTGNSAIVSRDADGKVVVALPDLAKGKVGVGKEVTVDADVGGDNGLHLGVNIGGSHGGNDNANDPPGVEIKVGGDNGLHVGGGNGGAGLGLGVGLGGLNL